MSKKRKTKNHIQDKKRIRRRRRRRFFHAAIIVLEIIILAILCVAAYGIYQYRQMGGGTLNQKDLEVYKDTGDYTNIALFGLDSRSDELEGGVRSDCIMIASINNKTNEVRLVSVYRDTLLQQKDGSFDKANAAYSYGGPSEAIALLNRNLDLDIQKYMSVNFIALADVIDELGGIDIKMTSEEVEYTNYYCEETAKVVGKETTELTGSGTIHCDGVQAVSYARIRYTTGDDFKRTHRQRIVLEKVIEAAQDANFLQLNHVIKEVLPQVSTNLSLANLVALAAHATDYEITEMSGFPFDVTTCDQVLDLEGSYVVPIGLTSNVKQLHEYLFDDTGYEPSETVENINDELIYRTGIDPETYGDGLDVSYSSSGADVEDSDTTGDDTSSDTTYDTYTTDDTYSTGDTYIPDDSYTTDETYTGEGYPDTSYQDNTYPDASYPDNTYQEDIYPDDGNGGAY